MIVTLTVIALDTIHLNWRYNVVIVAASFNPVLRQTSISSRKLTTSEIDEKLEFYRYAPAL